MGPGKLKFHKTALIAVATTVLGTASVAQDLDSAFGADVTLTTTLDANTNRALAAVSSGTTYEASETAGINFFSETSTQLLEFSSEISLTYESSGSITISDPTLDFSYAREGAGNRLALSGSYWSGDFVSAFDADPSEAVFLIVDTGSLVRANGAISYAIRRDTPLSLTFDASYEYFDYTGVLNMDELYDNETTTVGVTAGLRISPSTDGYVTAEYEDYSADETTPTASQTTSLEFGVTHELPSATTLSGNVGYSQTVTTAGGPATTSDALSAELDVTRQLSNGTIFGGVELDDIGSSVGSTLTLGRSLDLPDGSLSGSLTANIPASGSPEVGASATYRRELSNGAVSVEFDQSFESDSLGEAIKLSSLGLNYDRELSTSSSLNLSVDISRSEESAGSAAGTLNRATLSAAYSRELVRDWGLTVGYEHRANSTASSDSLFLTLTKDIEFRF